MTSSPPEFSAFVWSDRLATGIVDVDDQHRHLIELINRVGDLCMPGAAPAAIKAVLDELLEYTVYHFGTEEQLMRQYAISAHHQNIHSRRTMPSANRRRWLSR